MDNTTKKRHELSVISRKDLRASGVSKIRFFSSDTVAAETSDGLMIVKGTGLYVESLDSAEGVLLVRGKVDSVSYGEFRDGKSFLKRLFR